MGKGRTSEVDHKFRIPDALWQRIEPLLPVEPPKPKGGKPRVASPQRRPVTSVKQPRSPSATWSGKERMRYNVPRKTRR